MNKQDMGCNSVAVESTPRIARDESNPDLKCHFLLVKVTYNKSCIYLFCTL